MAGFFDDITARRSGVLDRLSAGEPVDPAEREQLDQISTASQGEFRKGLRRAGYNASATTSASLGQLTEPFAPDFAARQFDQAESYTQNQPANLRPEVESFRGAKDAESAGQFASGALGEAATSIAGMVAAGLAARFGLGGALRLGATGKNIAQFGGSMAAMLPQESGETALSLRQNPEAMANTTPAERAALSFGRGTVNAALESVVPNALLTNTISGAAGRIAAGVRPALTNVARKSAAGVVGEGATEGAQELTGQYAENLADPNAGYNRERVLEAAVRGAITGGVLGGAGGTVQAVRSNIDAAAETAAQKAREQVGTADQIFERIDNLIRNPEESGYDMTNTTMGALVEAQARVNELGREAAERAGPAAASGMEAIAAIRANFDRAVAGQLTPENRQRYAELTQNFRLLQPTEFERLRTAFDSGDATQINEAVGDVAFQLKERVPRETMDGLKNLTNWAKKFGSGVTRAAREGRKAAQAYDENDVRRFRSLLQEQYPDISETLDLLDSPISGKLTRALLAFRDKPELLHPESPQRIDPGLLGELVEKKTGATFPEVVAALRTQYNKKLTKAEKRAALAETSVSPTARRTETMELLLTDSMKEYLAENGLEVGPGATDTPDDTVEYIPASTTGSFGTELEKAIYRDDNERVDVEDTRRTPFNSLEQVRKLLGADILTKTDGTLINRPVNKDKRYTLTAVLRSDEEGITPQIIGRMLGGKESRSKGYDAKGKSLGFDGRPMGINEDTIAMRTTEDGGYRQEFNTIDIAAQAGTPQERGGSRENFEGFVPEFENNHRDLNIQGYRLLSAIASLQSEGIDIPRAEVPQDVVESLVAGTVDKVVGENATAAQRADALNKAVEQWRKGDNIQLKVELPQDSLSEDTIVQKKGSRAVTLGDLLGANRGARSLQAQYTLMTELGENPSGKLDLIQKGKEPLRELAKARAPGHDEFMAVLTNDEAFAAMSEEEQQAALDKREKRHAALVKEKARQIKLTADALRKGLWGFSAEREANQGNDLKESRGAALATILNKYAPAYVEELNYRITNAESKQRATYNLQQLKEGYREGMFTADDIKNYIVALGPPTPNERAEDAQLEFDPAVIESIDEFLVKEWADQLKLDYTGGGDLLNILEEFDNGWLMTELDQQNRFENPDPTTSEPTQDEIFNAAMKTSPEGTETRLNKRGIDKQNDAQVRAEMEAAAQRAGAQEIRAANEDIAAGEATERQADVDATVTEAADGDGTLRRAKGKVADRETITITTVNGDKLKRPIAAEFTLFGETFVIHKAADGKGWAVTRKDTARGIGVSGHKSISAAAEAGLARLRDVGRANVKRVAAENRRPTATEQPAETANARMIRERREAAQAAKQQKSVVKSKRETPQPEAKGVLTKREGETNKEFIQRMKAQQQQEQPAEAAAPQQPTETANARMIRERREAAAQQQPTETANARMIRERREAAAQQQPTETANARMIRERREAAAPQQPTETANARMIRERREAAAQQQPTETANARMIRERREAAAQQQPTPPPPPPPEEPPGGTPDNPVPPPPPPPDDEAQARFRATVKRLMGDRVDVAFDQDLPEGVAAEYQNRWGMDLENTAKALDAIYERRRELLREIKKTEAILNDPNNKIPFDELPDPMAMRNEVASLEEQAQAYRADLAVRGTIRVAAGMEAQAGLAEHESFHAAFEIFFGEDNANDRKVVTTAFTRGVLANRLQKYFAGNEEVLAVIDPTSPTFSAEEAAAYAFQVYLHEPGALQMGEKVEGIFNRFLRYLQKLVGYQTYEDRAKTIFNDLNSGRRSERGVSVLRDQPGMEKSMLNRSQDFVKAVGTGFMHMYDTVLSSSYSRLADSGNVAMAQIARLGYNETGERGQGMIQLQRLATTQWSNRLKTSLHALTAEELSQLNQAMVMNEELSGKLGEAQKRLRTLLNDVREYQTEAGVEMGFIEDYYPLVWNPDKVAADPQAFLKMLNNYPTEIAEMMKTPEEILDSILSWEDRGGEFQGVFGRDGEPVADSSRRRSLAFITAADRAKYVEDDLVTTMAHYINQSVRHAEYVRAYGQNGERLRQLMGEITGTYGGSQADVDLAKDYIDGLMGNKEVGMSRELKDLYGAATVYQNVRLLPLSVFSSLVDPLGVAVRTNSLGAAFDTFTYSIKNLFTDFRSKTNWTPDQWEQYADDMGTIDMSGTVKSIDKIYTGVTLRGKTREINDGFFKWNLLNGWVKNNHIMATKAAQLFLRRSAEGMFGEEMSAENLREVGVKPEDIMYDEALGRIRSTAPEILGYENAEQMEQQADPDDVQAAREQAQRIQQAIHKIVRQSMIQPSSAEMPSWMSNPYLAPIAHLKTFVFGFNATILNRLVYEAQRGNYNPIYYAAGYIPGMMAADFVKGLAGNGGEEPEWKKNWGLTDYVGYGVDRSGLTGTAQFFTDMNNDITRGGGGWETLAGPTIEQAHDLMAAMNGKTSEPTKTWMLNAMPVNDLYDQWLR